MNHAYVVQLPLAGKGGSSLIDTARLTRMEDRGWTIAPPLQGISAAHCGAANICQSQEWIVVGLAFLPDRAAVGKSLGMTSSQYDAKTDLELALALRIAQGDGWAKDTTGSYSLVFINKQSSAFEAYRDHFGLYPLYYTMDDGMLTCGSDIKTCLHLSGIPLQKNPQRIADFVQGQEISLEQTAFSSLYRLPPAHKLSASQGGLGTTKYWQLSSPGDFNGTDAPDHLRKALTMATQACVDAPEKTGAMLSGGLDSSSLAGLAAKNAQEPLQTLSFVYGSDKSYDETDYINAANDAFGTVSHKIPISSSVSLKDLGPLVEEQMDFFLAPGLQKSRQIYSRARSLGLDALIDGHGGDEAISHGYGRLVELAASRQFLTLYREARGAAKIHGVPLLALVSGHIARYSGLRPGTPIRRILMKFSRMMSRNSRVSEWPSQNITALIAPDLRASFDPQERYKSSSQLNSANDFRQAEAINHLAAVGDELMPHSFEVLHRSATAAGILPKYPFFDHRVLSLCLSLPSDAKLRDGRSRWVLREAMQGVLPEKIRLRTGKAEFGNEVQEAIIAYYTDIEPTDFAVLSDFIDVNVVERLQKQVLSGQIQYVSAIRALWRVAVLIHWSAAFDKWHLAQTKGTLI
ncbi:MAG: asparagine synthase-related protein [Roseobacter sp.]